MLQALNPKNSAVLIVEDDPDDAIIVGRALQAFGIQRMHHAETAEDALRVLKEHDGCDVVLLDYNLPGMNGLRLLSLIRESWPRVPVVLITGLRDETIAVSAMKAGAADYVAKDDLLTSHVIRSLQTALRDSIASGEAERRTTLSSGDNKLQVGIEEGEWQLDLLRRHPHDDTAARVRSQYGQEDISDLLHAFSRYLEQSFTRFPEPPRLEEQAVARMFIDRGSSPAEIVAVYVATLRALLLEGAEPPFNPALALVQLFAYMVDQYQLSASLTALEQGSASVPTSRVRADEGRRFAA
jgi:DNA-binding response OmpR family regulator